MKFSFIIIMFLTTSLAYAKTNYERYQIFLKWKLVDMAKEDLSNLLNVETEEIKLTHWGAETWDDTALGYPEKGEIYESGSVRGFVIILTVNGEDYEYHTDREETVKLDPKIKEIFSQKYP